MSGSKHFDKIAWTVTALILVVTILFMNGGALGLEVMAHTMGYENRLFDNTRVHTGHPLFCCSQLCMQRR